MRLAGVVGGRDGAELGDGGGDAGQSARALRQGEAHVGIHLGGGHRDLAEAGEGPDDLRLLGVAGVEGVDANDLGGALVRLLDALLALDVVGTREVVERERHLGAGAAALRLGVRDGSLRRVERARLVALVDGVVIQEARLRRRLDVGVLGTDGVERGGTEGGRGGWGVVVRIERVVARQQRGDDDILVGARAERRREQQREREW